MFDETPQSMLKLEAAIDAAMKKLDDHDVASPEYAHIVDQISKLHRLKEEEKPSKISKDTLAMITANLAGIVLIITHERVNVITTKALSLLLKPR